MRSHAAKIRRRFELTGAGLLFASVTAFVLVAAVNSQTNLLFFAFGLMLGAMVVSGAMAAGMLGRVEVTRQTAGHAVAGSPLELHYRLRNGKRRWGCFALRITEARLRGPVEPPKEGYCLHLAPGEVGTVMTQLRPTHRGVLALHEIRVTCAFPFGFVRRALHVARPEHIVVYPRIGILNREIALRCRDALASGPLTSQVRGGHDEFYGLREYRPGDNVRAIHWRRTAHTGEVMIREMTANAPPQMIVALDVRGGQASAAGAKPGEEAAAPAERAIELAAAAVCFGFAQGYAVGLWIVGDAASRAVVEPHPGREQRGRILEALARLDVSSLAPAADRPSLRGGAKAEWLVVSLTGGDAARSLVPPGAACTELPLDHPAAATWVKFEEPAASPAV